MRDPFKYRKGCNRRRHRRLPIMTRDKRFYCVHCGEVADPQVVTLADGTRPVGATCEDCGERESPRRLATRTRPDLAAQARIAQHGGLDEDPSP